MVLILAVVLSHVFNTYGIGLGWPYYEVGELNPAITVLGLLLVGIGVGFAMGLFFMIARVFHAPRLTTGKGFWRFPGDRLKRVRRPLADRRGAHQSAHLKTILLMCREQNVLGDSITCPYQGNVLAASQGISCRFRQSCRRPDSVFLEAPPLFSIF